MILVLLITAVTIIAVLVYVIRVLVEMQLQGTRVEQARQSIDSIHNQTIRAMFDAAQESGAFKKL